MKSCRHSTNIFQEAIDFQEPIDHCRWKKSLYPVLKRINKDKDDYKNNTFEEIYIDIHNICHPVPGLGLLTIYDITSAICRYYNVIIDKVYIIGNGPKRAIKLLNIKTKKHKINDKINLNYVDIVDVINAFNVNNYVLDENIRISKNGDILETYICNWQKTK